MFEPGLGIGRPGPPIFSPDRDGPSDVQPDRAEKVGPADFQPEPGPMQTPSLN